MNIMEGAHCYHPRSGCRIDGLVLPVAEYNHAVEGACSITGGYVYRGKAYPELRGVYFFGDFCSGVIYAMATPEIAGDQRPLPFVRALESRLSIASFGEDMTANSTSPISPAGRFIASYVDGAFATP